jgi:hypothetical protein
MKSRVQRILTLAVTAMVVLYPAQKALSQTMYGSCTSTISGSFNSTPIPANSYIYFVASLTSEGNPGTPATINVNTWTINFSANSANYSCWNHPPVSSTTWYPNASYARLTYYPYSVTPASSNCGYPDNHWNETLPVSATGHTFLAPCMFEVPAGGLPGGITPVTWSMTFVSSSSQPIYWQWAAAVYSELPFDGAPGGGEGGHEYGLLQIKPTDDGNVPSQFCLGGDDVPFCSAPYYNSDNAGTPEGFNSSNVPWKNFVIAGATGTGGSNWIGSWSSVGSCTPAPASADSTSKGTAASHPALQSVSKLE